MMPVFLNHLQSFILARAKLMLTFLENRLELGPETVFEMGELKILVSFIVARARNFDSFFFIDDTSIGISWKRVPSFLDAIKHKRSFPFILTRSRDILFISQIGFITIAKRSWSIGKRIDFVVVKAFFTSGIKAKVTEIDESSRSVQLYWTNTAVWTKSYWAETFAGWNEYEDEYQLKLVK